MKYECHEEIIANINHWHMEIDDSAYVYLDSDGWRGTDVCPPFSRLYLVADGEGLLEVAGKQIALRAGVAYFIPAGLTFSYRCADYLEKLYFHLRLVKPDGYDLAYGLPFIAQCSLDKTLLIGMLTKYRGNRWEDMFLLEQELCALTLRLLSQYNILQKSMTTYSPLVEEAMQYIHAHLSTRLTAEQLADALFTSKITLSRHFHQETGKTIHQYLEDMVFQSACKRLAVSDCPLGKISEELGFCDPFYFSRRFRQRYGESPSQYRKRLKIKKHQPILNK